MGTADTLATLEAAAPFTREILLPHLGDRSRVTLLVREHKDYQALHFTDEEGNRDSFRRYYAWPGDTWLHKHWHPSHHYLTSARIDSTGREWISLAAPAHITDDFGNLVPVGQRQ